MKYILTDINEAPRLLTNDKHEFLHGLLKQEPGDYLVSIIPDRYIPSPRRQRINRAMSKAERLLRRIKPWLDIACEAVAVISALVMIFALYFLLCAIG